MSTPAAWTGQFSGVSNGASVAVNISTGLSVATPFQLTDLILGWTGLPEDVLSVQVETDDGTLFFEGSGNSLELRDLPGVPVRSLSGTLSLVLQLAQAAGCVGANDVRHVSGTYYIAAELD